MTKTEYGLFVSLARSVGDNSFYNLLEKKLTKVKKFEDKVELLALNDRVVKRMRWDPKGHLHLIHRVDSNLPPATCRA